MTLRGENEFLRKQLAQAEWSSQQQRETEEQTLSGLEEQEEESDGVWIMYSVFTTAGYVCMCLYRQVYDPVDLTTSQYSSVQHTMYWKC